MKVHFLPPLMRLPPASFKLALNPCPAQPAGVPKAGQSAEAFETQPLMSMHMPVYTKLLPDQLGRLIAQNS